MAVKVRSAVYHAMAHSLSGVAPYYIVNEFPRSGGTWLASMLGVALDAPFAQHRPPPAGRAVLHGHFRHGWGLNNVVMLWRDGRDVLTSFYHYWMFRDQISKPELSAKVRADLSFADPEDVRRNMLEFIEYCFTRQRYPRFSWAEFVRLWAKAPGVVHARYEDLHADAAVELTRIVREVSGVELDGDTARKVATDFAFEKRAGRATGEEDRGSFMRKGIVGDWQNAFSTEARAAFERYAGDALVALGYEQDIGWANGSPSDGE